MTDFDVDQGDRVEVVYRDNGQIHSRLRGRVGDIQSRPGPIPDVAVIEVPFGGGALGNMLRVRPYEVEIEEVDR